MLRLLPDNHSPEPAYPVPWVIDRSDPSHPLVANEAGHTLDFVRVFIHRPRRAPAMQLWGMMLPGSTVQVCLCDVDPDDAVVTLAWFRPDDGREYVWRFVL